MSRRDDLDISYKKSGQLNTWCQLLFWANCNLAALSLFWDGVANEVSMLLQILSSFAYLVLKCVDDGHYLYIAECARRKNNLENALNIDLTEYQTEEYYNNTLRPSIAKYAMNTFESVLFSKEIAGKMFVYSIIKACCAVASLITLGWLSPNYGIILVISQAVLSTYVIEETIMLALYKSKLEKLFELFYSEFVTVGICKKTQLNLLLSYVVEYEAIKAHYKVRISSKVFHKYNSNLSSKWESIKTKCKINDKLH